MEIFVRYDVVFDGEETRRERNARFGMAHKSADIDVPDVVEYLWQWFFDLSRGRSSGMNGPNPLSALEIDAWERKTGNIVSRDDFQAIQYMDGAYRNQFAEEQAAIVERDKG